MEALHSEASLSTRMAISTERRAAEASIQALVAQARSSNCLAPRPVGPSNLFILSVAALTGLRLWAPWWGVGMAPFTGQPPLAVLSVAAIKVGARSSASPPTGLP